MGHIRLHSSGRAGQGADQPCSQRHYTMSRDKPLTFGIAKEDVMPSRLAGWLRPCWPTPTANLPATMSGTARFLADEQVSTAC
jgi:hypothetical protein